MKLDALRMFGYNQHDLINTHKFNEKIIERKFKYLSKVHHPDSGGTAQSFAELNLYHGILIALCQPDANETTNDVTNAKKTHLAITYPKKPTEQIQAQKRSITDYADYASKCAKNCIGWLW